MQWLRRRIGGLDLSWAMLKGVAEAVAACGLSALFLWLAVSFADLHPSQQTLGRLPEIGAALLIAYAIAATRIVSAARRRPGAERELRVGWFVGIGVCGLAGILIALVLSNPIRLSWDFLDEAAFAVACASLLLLGLTVVLQPLAVHEWSEESSHTSGE